LMNFGIENTDGNNGRWTLGLVMHGPLLVW